MMLLGFLVITGIFLVPFTAAAFYFFLGVRSCVVGKRENNKVKLIGGYNSMAYSLLAMIAIFFVWYLIVGEGMGIYL